MFLREAFPRQAHPAAAKPQPLAPECFMLLILEVIAQHP